MKRVVAKAICERPGTSTERRCLFATELTPRGAYILSFAPYDLGTKLAITFFPRKLNPLPRLEARVIAARLDPADAEASGFEVVFFNMDPADRERLVRATETLAADEPPPSQPGPSPRLAGPERRVAPRVSMNLTGRARIGALEIPIRIENMSLSGALVAMAAEVRPLVGADALLTLMLDPAGESSFPPVRVDAVAVSCSESGDGIAVGVRFVDPFAVVGDLEELMLESVIGGRAGFGDLDPR